MMWPLPWARIPGQHGLDRVDHAEVVGVEERADLGVLALLDRGEVAVAGVVDQHVDPAEGLLGRGDRARDLGLVGDVERDGERAVAEVGDEVLRRPRRCGR